MVSTTRRERFIGRIPFDPVILADFEREMQGKAGDFAAMCGAAWGSSAAAGEAEGVGERAEAAAAHVAGFGLR